MLPWAVVVAAAAVAGSVAVVAVAVAVVAAAAVVVVVGRWVVVYIDVDFDTVIARYIAAAEVAELEQEGDTFVARGGVRVTSDQA